MRLLSFTLLALVCSAFAAPLEDMEPCGTHISDEEVQRVEKEHLHKLNITGDAGDDLFKRAVMIYISWNTMTETSGGKGTLTDQQIDDTISKLNKSFLGSGFYFSLYQKRTFVKPEWFNGDKNSVEEKAMKKSLRSGNVRTLNIYTTNFGDLTPKLLGHATFPWDYTSQTAYLDGVVAKYIAVAGGSSINYNQGTTFVHEVGHWLGLYHTFQGGCNPDPNHGGDYVYDTAAQADSTSGCPVVIPDTCPNLPGKDQINNYMDYTYDRCRDSFTSGQVVRLRNMWALYRGIL